MRHLSSLHRDDLGRVYERVARHPASNACRVDCTHTRTRIIRTHHPNYHREASPLTKRGVIGTHPPTTTESETSKRRSLHSKSNVQTQSSTPPTPSSPLNNPISHLPPLPIHIKSEHVPAYKSKTRPSCIKSSPINMITQNPTKKKNCNTTKTARPCQPPPASPDRVFHLTAVIH